MRYIYQSEVQDGRGNFVAGATVTVTLAGGTTKASIYSALTGGTVDADGIITTGTDGTFAFYVDEDDYSHSQQFRIVWSKSGFTSETWDYIQIFPDGDRTLLTSSTVDQGDNSITGTLAWHFADATGGPIKINVLSGTYLISTLISVSSETDVELTGDAGADLTFDSLDEGILFTSVDRLRISGLTFSGTTKRTLNFDTCTDVHIVENDISGATKTTGSGLVAPIYFDDCSRVWVEGNYLHGNGDDSVACAEIATYEGTNTDFYVLDNKIEGLGSQFGIFLLNCSGDAVVHGNQIDLNYKTFSADADGYGITVYRTSAIGKMVIEGNIISRTAGSGIYCVGNDAEDFTIANNVISDVTKTQTDVSLPVAGISVSNLVGGTITGNRINISVKDGICVANSSQIAVVGNSLEDITQYGIRIRGTGDNITIANNTLLDLENSAIVQDTAGAHTNITVTGNVINDVTTGQGISFAEASDCVVVGNVIDTIAIDGIIFTAGANNIISSNRITGVAANFSVTYAGATSGVITNNLLIGNAVGYLLAGAVTNKGNQLSAGVSQGQAVLIAGTVTVSTAEVVASDGIVLSRVLTGGTEGTLSVGTITAGTSFVINSSNAADTSTIFWQIVH